ncbi:lauroyl acyltransferase [Aristophania vespae]|uniref:Lauroyl acyltransferase n=1 Tax=Aristophania vespae TaxID=2697033 RepID=A0A6P1NDR4_9PROT|nr:lysophospholipid acyltransferase family protein [Aristophania vespae]QHI95638.1 lauroyl acyltransferase [Aristophania vespae]UMM63315.1 Lipid A biosynthesis lauroyltransferase [Aristophania vespae]
MARSTIQYRIVKYYLYWAQSSALNFLIFILSYLPIQLSSFLVGYICRFIGPFLSLSKIAHRNLELAFPQSNVQWRQKIIHSAWENLGRTFGEFPHIHSLQQNMPSGPSWRIIGEEFLHQAKSENRPVIFFSGHFGNWELLPAIIAQYGLAFAPFYRSPNNPFLDQTIRKLRAKALGFEGPIFPKGAKGAKEAIKHIMKGGHLGILGDQKMNDGIEIRFFNLPTMAAPAAATLALRYKALIITGHILREDSTRFVLKVDPPLDLKKFAETHPDFNHQTIVQETTQTLNDRLQEWIEAQPSQWLWFHRRWDKRNY